MNTTQINKEKTMPLLSKLGIWALIYSVGIVLLAISSRIKFYIPVSPVPITLQTLTVAMIGIVMGKKAGPGIVIAYFLTGLAGLPVFSAGTNITFTAGYLIGMIAQSFIAGLASEIAQKEGNKILNHLISASLLIVSFVVMFAFGWAWLSVAMGDSTRAFMGGVVPFLLGDGLKLAIAFVVLEGVYQTGAYKGINRFLDKIRLF